MRRLYALIDHLPAEAVIWRVLEATKPPSNVKTVSDFAREYRSMKRR